MISINVYDVQLNRIGAIDTWISLVWDESYRDEGAFQLEVWQTDDMVALLREDVYCAIADSNTLAVIKSVRLKNGRLVCGGYMLPIVLADRVGMLQVMGMNAETAMRTLVKDMTAYPLLSLGGSAGIKDVFEPELRDENVLEYCKTISEATDVGFRIRHDKTAKKLLFECYKPTANVNARYASAYGNLGEIQYSRSTIEYKNVAVIVNTYSETVGEGDAKQTVENRTVLYAGATSTTGADRREMIVKTGLTPEEDETDAAFRARIIAEGEAALVEQVKIENITFEVDDDRAQLGDVITVLLPELNVNLTVRVIAVKITSQRNKNTREISVGTPITRHRRK